MQAAPGKGRGRGRARVLPGTGGFPVATTALLTEATRALQQCRLQHALPEAPLPETPPETPSPKSASPLRPGDHCKAQTKPVLSNGKTALVQRSDVVGITLAPRAGAFPARPGYGREGHPIAILANHFELQLPTGLFYHYDVDIGSLRHSGAVQSVISKDCKRRVFQLLVRQHEHHLNGNLPVFDGQKNMYTRKSLNFQKKVFNVTMEEEGRKPDTFVVSIQYAATLDMSLLQAVYDKKLKEVPQAVVQAFDIVLRYGPSTVHAMVGRSVFTPPGNFSSIGGGLELWHGYQTSVRPAQWKPLLNVNTVATAFFEGGPLLELVSKVLGDRRGNLDLNQTRRLNDIQFVKLNKKLKKLKIKVTHLPYPRKYIIERVTRATANEIEFGDPPITVAAYFASKYRPLRFPYLPCIEVGTKKNYIPLEVCVVLDGQHCRQKLDENQTATVVKKAAVPPAERFQNIQGAVRDCIKNNKEYLDHFGIHISTDPVKVQARVLPAPDVLYKNNVPVSPRNGAWEIQGTEFYQPANMTKWSVLSLCNTRFCPRPAIEKFVSMVISHGKKLGMSVEPPQAIKECGQNNRLLNVLRKEKETIPGLQIVFVVVVNKSPFYNELKSAGETEIGVMTQCVTDKSITNKCNPMLVNNILQKVNAKLGGVNNTIPKSVKSVIFSKPVIVMGADVTHPGAKEFNRPSIAAVVASTDPFAFRYITAFRIQKQNMEVKARVEIIEDMKNIAKELLLGFYNANNQIRPHKILFYRDGVSESQFRQVLDHELAAIRAACVELEPGYEPGITFLTVQKRHHTRFMPENRRDGCGKSGNIPPGTTIDTTVTHPVDFDFFLCSHFGIQGTSRPAHYYVLWDDNEFTADALQKLTFGLCHTYARCARSVSIPVPVYYAHHATQRAKCYVDARSDIYDSAGSSSGGSLPSMDFLDAAISVQSLMKGAMFFV
uniref:Putative eukaryotic translation initiation factor 2c n=1 Tax=Ixodes ricinus TaxID=34613 RepID=A0A131XXA7_IXORI